MKYKNLFLTFQDIKNSYHYISKQIYQKINTIFSFLVIFVLSFLITACPDENENLVNPPPNSSTVKVRVINLAGDKEPRELKFDDYSFGVLPYLSVTNAVNPPADSVDLTIYKNNTLEFEQFRKQRFTRNLRYTLFILPSGESDSVQRVVDTVISISTSIVRPTEINKSNIRVFNSINDSNTTITLKQGCQNGQTIGLNVSYRSASIFSSVISGKNSFTIIQNSNGKEQILGTYEILLEEFLEYTIVIAKNLNGQTVVYLLDDNGEMQNAFNKIEPLTNTQTQLRAINLSKNDIILKDNLGNSVINNLNPNSYTKYNLVTACSGSSLDKFIASSNGQEETFFTSLELNQKFTTLHYNTKISNEDKLKTLVIKEFKMFENWSGKSLIRVVNLYQSETALTVSVGTRSDASIKSLNYRSGEILASELPYETISGISITQSGYFPITVFAASQPINYLTGVIENIEQNKSYLLIINGSNGEKPTINLIEDYYDSDGQNSTITNSEEGVFYQIVNANSDLEFIKVELGNIITNANLYYGTSISGVVKAGTQKVNFGNKERNYNFAGNTRPIIVGIGNKDNQDMIDATTNISNLKGRELRRRFINATQDVDAMSVYINDNSESAIAEISGILQNAITDYKIDNTDNKMTMYFRNTNTQDSLSRVTDVKLSFTKGYTLIYAGKKSNDNKVGYNLIIQQEF